MQRSTLAAVSENSGLHQRKGGYKAEKKIGLFDESPIFFRGFAEKWTVDLGRSRGKSLQFLPRNGALYEEAFAGAESVSGSWRLRTRRFSRQLMDGSQKARAVNIRISLKNLRILAFFDEMWYYFIKERTKRTEIGWEMAVAKTARPVEYGPEYRKITQAMYAAGAFQLDKKGGIVWL